MDPDGQVLGNHFLTTTTDLAGVLGIHLHEHPTSLCRFVGCELQELTPRSISDAAVHALEVAVHHLPNLQILDTDDAESVDDVSTQLVGEVGTTIGDPLPDLLMSLSFLCSSFGPDGRIRDLSGDLPQSFLVDLQESRILDDLSVGEGGE